MYSFGKGRDETIMLNFLTSIICKRDVFSGKKEGVTCKKPRMSYPCFAG
jgi:hypothetical protein